MRITVNPTIMAFRIITFRWETPVTFFGLIRPVRLHDVIQAIDAIAFGLYVIGCFWGHHFGLGLCVMVMGIVWHVNNEYTIRQDMRERQQAENAWAGNMAPRPRLGPACKACG